MDGNLNQSTGAQNKDISGDFYAKDRVANESPRLNEAPAREEALPMSENTSGLGNYSLAPYGNSLRGDPNQDAVEISAEVQDDLDEDRESYMDDSSL